jgi:hypothetical protein
MWDGQESMTCVYCRKDSGRNPGLAHIFPEALHCNDEVLPRGAVCDVCNEYLGRRLDENLIRYPSIAFAIQFLATPGKKGKPRKRVGAIDREIPGKPDVLLQTKTERPSISTGPNGVKRAHVLLSADPQFRMPRFRRALHHVAFNIVAKLDGPDKMLTANWDLARNYIRFPGDESECWPYAQLTPSPTSIRRAVRGVRWESGRRELISVQIFQTMFVVDLANTGELEDLARNQNAEYFGADRKNPTLVSLDVIEENSS